MSSKRVVHLLALVWLAAGCAKSNPAYSGETHFMAVCDGDCEAGLTCICGVCTRACESDRECRALNAAATCGAPGTPAGSCQAAAATTTCSVACSDDRDCAALGGGFACLRGECRGNVAGSCALGGSVYPDGAGDIAAGDGCNTCRCRSGELVCTRADCASATDDAGAISGSPVLESVSAGQADSGPSEDVRPPPLASLRGTFVAEAGLELQDVALRMALVWYPAYLEGPEMPVRPSAPCANPEGLNLQYRGLVAQELELEPASIGPISVGSEVPLPFTVHITELPPPEALRPAPDVDGGSWTAGKLILYVDDNGNERLDSGTLAQPSPDTVVGTSSDWHAVVERPADTAAWYDIYYSDVQIDSVGPAVAPGFNLRRITNDPEAGHPTANVALDTPIPIVLRANPRNMTLHCEELCFVGDDSFTCPANAADLPAEGVIECLGQSELAWLRSTCEGCTCMNVSCLVARGETAQTEWPCP